MLSHECMQREELTCHRENRHLGCIGAFIVIMAHGFETFSQQMVIFEQRPRQLVNGESIPAPEPPRAEV